MVGLEVRLALQDESAQSDETLKGKCGYTHADHYLSKYIEPSPIENPPTDTHSGANLNGILTPGCLDITATDEYRSAMWS